MAKITPIPASRLGAEELFSSTKHIPKSEATLARPFRVMVITQ